MSDFPAEMAREIREQESKIMDHGPVPKPSTYVKVEPTSEHWLVTLFVNNEVRDVRAAWTRLGAERVGQRILKKALRAEKENAYYIYREDL